MTPEDISFVYSTIPPSKMASGSQSAAKQIDAMKNVKEQLNDKISELSSHDDRVREQYDKCCDKKEQYMGFILHAVKSRLLSSNFSSVSAASDDKSTGARESNEKNTSARLEAHMSFNKISRDKPSRSDTKSQKRTLQALLNKTAEEQICRLEYDEAFDAMVSEVSKLEKKFVAQKNKAEGLLLKRMNELLLRQMEVAEEKRTLNEMALKEVIGHTRTVQEEANKKHLNKALSGASSSEVKLNTEVKQDQEQFEFNLIETEEYFNKLLIDINAKRILEMQKLHAANSKVLEKETRQLVEDKSEIEQKQKQREEISDELFRKLREQSDAMAKRFNEVYSAAQELVVENRNKPDGNSPAARQRVPLQSELVDRYTDIHNQQCNFAENPILDFEMELSKVVEENEANAEKFFERSEKMYKDCQEQYMKLILQQYEATRK